MRLSILFIVLVALGLTGYLLYDDGVRIEIVRSAEAIVPEVLVRERPVTLLFTGDLMLDRGVANHARLYGDDSLFKGVKTLMQDADAVVVNLETTLTDLPPVAVGGGMDLRFTSDPRFAKLLKDLGVEVATLSNNHTDDFGSAGLIATKENLEVAGIAYYGSPANAKGELSVKTEVGGRTVCFAGYEGFINIDPAPIADEIRLMASGCDFIAATMHAGEEYVNAPTLLQQNAARAFIDAGADVVIGTHPHIVQPLEFYKGKPIFYSLGNFIFDQDFSWNTTHGLLVRATIEGDATRYDLIPANVIRAEASATTDPADVKRLLSMLTHSTWDADLSTEILEKKSFTVQ